ncbi:FHA domain-containing protein [Phycicoccus sp. HDW14]|uniref:FtsK/SpoIIIE domain-containing protein n=1 Tax=Phycicoccus sp. HDW14 TaxID=2714941 RepID=UPI00140CA7E9|nr:FtsK/SpoIIIE domain-containing protein [Phycicoccus sp. HDW14]QIM21645.1 FHA domain-containing protein [Phycicoccus sp. HDW14]
MPSWTLSVSPAAETALPAVDVTVEAQPHATVADLARALGGHLAPDRRDLLVVPTSAGRPWPAATRLSECAMRTGDLVDVVTVPTGWLERPAPARDVRAVLRVVDGPDAGRTIGITTPSVVVGRAADATVRLTDPLVSARHARLDLTGEPTVVDEGSANGTLVDGVRVTRATPVPVGTPVVVGATTFVLDRDAAADPASVSVYRSPRFGAALEVDDLEVPSPPTKPRPTPLQWAMVALPVVMGVGLYLQTRSPFALTYVFAWPMVMAAGWWQQRRAARKEHEAALASWRRRVALLTDRLDAQAAEQHRRAVEDHPDTPVLLRRAGNRDGSLWVRREDGPDFLAVRVGRGPVPALLTASLREGGDEEVTEEVQAELERRRTIPDTPVLAPMALGGLVAVVGPADEVDAAVRALLARVCLDHSPVDVSVAAALSPARAHHETWLRWMPHARPRVGGEPSIAVGAPDGQRLLDRLLAEDGGHGHTVLLVDSAAGLQRRSIEAAAAVAVERRLHLVFLGDDASTVPASTDLLLDLTDRHLSVRDRGGRSELDTTDALALGDAWRAARLVTGRVDEAAVLPADSALPARVRLPDLMADLADLDDTEAVIGRWGSSTGLRAQVGAGVDGVVTLDLREDGPHGLVAGTTGSGKSELLQTLLCSLAANTPPSRITFLLVDYKGGAAFRECADLPHTVGYITDLTPALVQRALTSLGAEIAHREELLAEHGAKDLVHLEREHPELAPPSLLICIDEFAALTAEVPDFVEGMVNLAQRGRSLGMHLLLATQRPAGVVTPAIRANTDLRIALRIASDEDSRDVIDTPDAAHISRRTPGRAWVRRTGHGTAEMVQAAWVGAREPLRTESAAALVRPFTAARPAHGSGAGSERLDPRTDLDRCVRTIRAAHERLGSPAPRRPWLPALPAELLLDPAAVVAAAPSTGSGRVPLGRADDPQRQTQPGLVVDYAATGHLLVHGASGSGKTELLRTVAAAASLVDAHAPGGVAPYVYAVDMAGGGLGVLEALPTVASVVGEQHVGRILRLLRVLRATVEDRSAALAAAGAADLAALARAGRPLPRVHLLVDNLPALLDLLDGGGAVRRAHTDMLQTVLQNGRRVGIHVTATAPGRGGVPTAMAAAFGTRATLRMPTEDDYVMLGVPHRLLDAESPAGAAIWSGRRAQVATVAGGAGTVEPAQLEPVAALLRTAVDGRASGAVPPMPTLVPAHALPVPEGSRVAVGVLADDVSPLVVDLLAGPVLVAGRSRSGRTSVLAGVASLAARSSEPPTATAWFGRGAPEGTTHLDGHEALAAWLEERLDDPRTGGAWDLLVVDDAHRLDRDLEHRPELAGLVALVERAAGHRVAVVVAADADDARTRSMGTGVVQVVRRSRRGLLLQPDGLDGTVMAVTVPTQSVEPLTGPGRGTWCADGAVTPVHAVTDVEGAPR